MKPIKKLYFVYIITNLSRTVLYTGVTNNLRYRLYQHEFQNYGMNSFTKKIR
ncbi:GIY-YIG nuclease family protein [Sphingobacterium sp.]|uniref:GIY-YIG nuclease family protein n=1 Tax=Sphingobacterium sp. TaxID=341027 RepID=UPI0028AD4AB1|nr:GIY-YIG nuclease family protein [Sphingobacterium sp.]